MSLLFKNLRIHQILGSNTNVGKTIFATALARSSAARNTPVYYLKPVSTGGLEDADHGCVTSRVKQASTDKRLNVVDMLCVMWNRELSMRTVYSNTTSLSVHISQPS